MVNRQLSRSIAGAGALIGAGLAVSRLPGDELTMVVRAAACIAVTTAAGYGIHRIKAWASERPVMPSPSQVYAVSQQYGPELAGDVARVEVMERTTEPDDTERRWHTAIIRFAVLGSMKRSFGWHAMKRHVDRPGWDRLTHSLADAGVLRVGRGRTPTGFEQGWYCRRVWVGLQRGEIAPPCPAVDDLPDVRW